VITADFYRYLDIVKKMNASAPTTFRAEYRLPLRPVFWPKTDQLCRL